MSRRPLVGIAPARIRDDKGRPTLAVRSTYLDALRAAGALPVVLGDADPGRAAEYVAALDGLVIPGGPDLNPRLYGEEPGPALDLLDDDIGELYLALLHRGLEARLPVFGICLGLQVMNVALGGSLVQDLGAGGPVRHQKPGGGDERHSVAIEPGTLLAEAMGASQADVTSYHHQAISRLGDRLRVTALAPDGIIEGVEIAGEPFFVGVQWHPERSLDDPANRRLFASFVRAAAAPGPPQGE